MNKRDTIAEVATLHEQVRAFVQKAYPDQIVVDIEQTATSRYTYSQHLGEYVLDGQDCEFVVESVNAYLGGHCYRFRISLLTDSSLRFSDKQLFMEYRG